MNAWSSNIAEHAAGAPDAVMFPYPLNAADDDDDDDDDGCSEDVVVIFNELRLGMELDGGDVLTAKDAMPLRYL